MSKELLRQQLKNKRQLLSLEEVNKADRAIITNCLAIIDWTGIQSVHTYLAITKNNEINPLPLIKYARLQNPDMKVASWDSFSQSVQAQWLDSNFKPLKDVPQNFQYGLIIVPLLGFDSYGHRLGYGGGFYDKFLAGQAHALTIGLCYEFGHVKKLPKESHDIPLNIVVTEEKIYKI